MADDYTLRAQFEAPSPSNMKETEDQIIAAYDELIALAEQRLEQLEESRLARLRAYHSQVLGEEEAQAAQEEHIHEETERKKRAATEETGRRVRRSARDTSDEWTKAGKEMTDVFENLGRVIGISIGMFGFWQILSTFKDINDELRSMKFQIREIIMMSGEMPGIGEPSMGRIAALAHERQREYDIPLSRTIAEVKTLVTEGMFTADEAVELSEKAFPVAARWGMGKDATARSNLMHMFGRWNRNTDMTIDQMVSTFDRLNRTATRLNKPLAEYRKEVEELYTVTARYGWSMWDAEQMLGRFSDEIARGTLTVGQLGKFAGSAGQVTEGAGVYLLNQDIKDPTLRASVAAVKSVFGDSPLAQGYGVRGLGAGWISASENADLWKKLEEAGFQSERGTGVEFVLGLANEFMGPMLDGLDDVLARRLSRDYLGTLGIDVPEGQEQSMLTVLQGIRSNTTSDNIAKGVMDGQSNEANAFLKSSREISNVLQTQIHAMLTQVYEFLLLTLGEAFFTGQYTMVGQALGLRPGMFTPDQLIDSISVGPTYGPEASFLSEMFTTDKGAGFRQALRGDLSKGQLRDLVHRTAMGVVYENEFTKENEAINVDQAMRLLRYWLMTGDYGSTMGPISTLADDAEMVTTTTRQFLDDRLPDFLNPWIDSVVPDVAAARKRNEFMKSPEMARHAAAARAANIPAPKYAIYIAGDWILPGGMSAEEYILEGVEAGKSAGQVIKGTVYP